MISRAFSAIKKRLKVAASAIIYFLVGDVVLFFQQDVVKKINLKADESPSGVAVLQFGRGYYRKNLAIIRSKLSPKEVEAQLKCVMDIREEKARSPYTIFQWLTESPFFLAMPNDAAMLLRRESMRQLTSAELIQQAEIHHEKFLKSLLQKTDKDNIHKSVFSYIHHVLLSQLLGTKEVPLAVTELMMKIDLDINMLLAAIFPRFFELRPDTRSAKKKFQQVCSIISEIIGDQNSLIDPSNRLRVAFLFASSNLSKILSFSLQRIFARRSLYSQLINEINSDSETMPYLHAFYLEALRMTAAMNAVLRYTANGISTNDLIVPPNSLIVFDIEHLLRNPLYFKNPTEFNPKRFFENEYSLHHGVLSPFGLGMRICPAVNISEKLFKWIIINTVKNIEPPQYTFDNLFFDFYKIWERVPSNDPCYDTYVANQSEKKCIDDNRLQFILNADITFENNNEPHINTDILFSILYQAATYSFLALIPCKIACVNVGHNMSEMNEAKKSYDQATTTSEKEPFVQTLSHHWNILMDKQFVIDCEFKEDTPLDMSEQAKTTANTLNAISDDIFKNAGCVPFFNNHKECKLNGYFSYTKPRDFKQHRFFQLVQSHMKPYDQNNGAVDYPKLTVDKDFVLSTPAALHNGKSA